MNYPQRRTRFSGDRSRRCTAVAEREAPVTANNQSPRTTVKRDVARPS